LDRQFSVSRIEIVGEDVKEKEHLARASEGSSAGGFVKCVGDELQNDLQMNGQSNNEEKGRSQAQKFQYHCSSVRKETKMAEKD